MSHSKTIFVTGGTGFLGSYLIRYLLKKQAGNIRALKRVTSSMALLQDVHDQIDWVEGDILDIPLLEDALEGVDEIYHCAAVVSFDPKDIKMMMDINVTGTANMVNIALTKNIRKFIHVSSIAAIGRAEGKADVSEKTKWQNSKFNSNYAISKYQAEQEVWRGEAEGLNIAIVNPSVIIGSGFWKSGTARFWPQVYHGLKFYPKGASGFVDVRDVAKYMIQLMESDISSERFLLNGDNLSFQNFFGLVARQIGKSEPTIKVNTLIAEMAWRLEKLRAKVTGKSPLITKETARNSSQTYIYKNQKSLNALNFKYTPIKHTIEETSVQFLEAAKNGMMPKSLPLV